MRTYQVGINDVDLQNISLICQWSNAVHKDNSNFKIVTQGGDVWFRAWKEGVPKDVFYMVESPLMRWPGDDELPANHDLTLMKQGQRVFVRLGIKGCDGFIAELHGIHEDSITGLRNRVISADGSIWYYHDAVTSVYWDEGSDQWIVEAYAKM